MAPQSPLVACPDCDALQREPSLEAGGSALCVRCGAELSRHRPHAVERTLAYVLAAGIALLVANAFPLMEMQAATLHSQTTVVGSARAMIDQGMSSVGMVVFVTALVLPAVELAAIGYVLATLHLGILPPGLRLAFHIAHAVRPWGMAMVYVLGALVAYAKLADVATIQADAALYAMGAYIVLLAAAVAAYEPRGVWARARELGA